MGKNKIKNISCCNSRILFLLGMRIMVAMCGEKKRMFLFGLIGR